ncbi:hypothetical protein N752_18275 [Desulforamulus aquiferis]|nr:spore germination protein [Desulforamulus aquiferis]RYD03695.1 hypothetical protein N752_18275 [Desulforamulus aquiferis]
MIRRRLKSPKFTVETTTLGLRSRSRIAIVYISDIADPKIVEEVRNRISKINIDGILASGYIERFIEDHPWSLFPQVYGTERPDKIAANLLEGRVGIIVDGTPYA